MYAWMARHLPQFRGTVGEDPVIHCQHFHHICRHMKPENETLEKFKMECFKHTLTDFATIWYYSSTASCAGYYEDLRAQFLKEFSPPSLRHDTREKIIRLQQSRDETLDEYYTYFDTVVSRCPHHGFTNEVLLQKFLCGMRPVDQSRINDAVGGSAMHLTMTQMWDVIDDLAEATKRRPMLQADRRAQMVEANLERSREDIAEAMMVESDTESTGRNEEEPTWEITPEPSEELEPESDTVWDEEEPTWEITPEPSEELEPETDTVWDEEKPSWELTTEAAEEINQDQVLTDRLADADPVHLMRASQLFPLINMQIAENYVINDESEIRMEERPKQNDSLMEHFFATTRPGSPKHKRARLKKPIVKGPSPSQRCWKEKPPEQWEQDPSTSFHKNSGKVKARIKVGTVEKYDPSHPWDPNL